MLGLFSYITNPYYWWSILFSLPGILIGLTFHEFAHAWTADKLGDATPRMMGRLTLNPLKHLNLIGTIAIILFRIGWAKPVPINPANFKSPRRDTLLVSLAGPGSNLMIAGIFTTLYWIATAVLPARTPVAEYTLAILGMGIFLNFILAFFNLIPIPPLDGSQILFSLIRLRDIKVVLWLKRYGFLILIVLIISGILGLIVITPARILSSLLVGHDILSIIPMR